MFFGLPALGVKLSAWEAGLLQWCLTLKAYSAEIIRAGIDATPKGQWEAGKTLAEPDAKFLLEPYCRRLIRRFIQRWLVSALSLCSALLSYLRFQSRN
ncbi:hypothetical protein P4S64_13100 [Vibrio sp. M60_M31a]